LTVNASQQMVGITSLQDGLDYDHNEIWVSPDIGNVYRYDAAGNSVLGDNGLGQATPVLSGAGGFSGVERVDVGANSFLILVNDASSPRRLDVRELDGTLIGQENFVNQRYEDLAFDGRYLYAADFFGHKIDKFDVLADGGSIFVPPAAGVVPEPTSLLVWSLLLCGTGLIANRRQRAACR
jgi:hypothetical protein